VSQCIVPNGRVVGGKRLEGSGFRVIEINSHHCLEGQRAVMKYLRIAGAPSEILSTSRIQVDTLNYKCILSFAKL
jgi:hypothetical protein